MSAETTGELSDADVKFLMNLDFLQGWTPKQLNNQEGKLIECCYKRGAVIVKNSSCSRWICVIKSGSAQVLLALDKVHPRLRTADSAFKRPQTSRIQPPYPRNPRQSSEEDQEFVDDDQEQQQQQQQRPSFITHLQQRPQTSSVGSSGRSATSANLRPATVAALDPLQSYTRSAYELSDQQEEEDPAACLVATNQLDKRYHRYDNDTDVQLPAQPQFARLRSLTSGETFGLQELFRTDQPSLSLISGAPSTRCLLLDKAFYVEQSPKWLLDRQRNQVAHYPTRRELQQRLQERVNWEAYKQLRVRAVLTQAGKRLV